MVSARILQHDGNIHRGVEAPVTVEPVFVDDRDENLGSVLVLADAGLGADAIRIVRDKRPDFVSTCYRATVEFYRLGKTRPPEPVEILVDRPEMRL